jgi:high-affinity Fe2+/Pb2+ permease
MKNIIKRYHKEWIKLDPSSQFMAWSAGGVIFAGFLALVFTLIAPNVSGENFEYVVGALALGVFLMSGVFIYAILFLTVIWPHHYQARQDKL